MRFVMFLLGLTLLHLGQDAAKARVDRHGRESVARTPGELRDVLRDEELAEGIEGVRWPVERAQVADPRG
ncbi:MAG: hypothetical protein CBC62_00785, partial [Opitutia bacterium TMED102]